MCIAYRFSQTIARFFRKKRAWLAWERVPDPRDRRGRRWSLPQRLQTLWAGLVVLKGSLRALDAALAHHEMALAPLGAGVRIPDATRQAVLPRLHPEGVRQVLIGWNR